MEGRVMNKKRVALGDLSNLSNVAVSVNKVQGKESKKKQAKGKLKSKTEVAKPASEVKTDEVSVDKPVDIDAKSVDPQMCGYYASDIYKYLRQMEVFFLSHSHVFKHVFLKVSQIYSVFSNEPF